MRVSILLYFIFSSSFIWSSDKLIEKDFRKKVYKNPLREISIIITDDGYYPSKMFAYVGEKVRFFVTSTSKKGQCFILQKHEVFISAERNQVNELDVVVDNPGRYKFYCPSTKHFGYLTVMEKNSAEKEVERAVASENTTDKPKYWTPRDYD